MEIELGEKEIAISNIFESITGVMPLEIVDLEEAMFFVVPFSKITKVIGKGGENVKKLEKRFKKKIFIFGNSNNIKQFARNLFNNVKVYQVDVAEIMGQKAVTLIAEESDKKKIIGVNGVRIKGARELMKRMFDASLHVKTKRVV